MTHRTTGDYYAGDGPALAADVTASWRCEECDQEWVGGELASAASMPCDACGAPCGWCGGEGDDGKACQVCGETGRPPFGELDEDLDDLEVGR